MSTVDPTGPTVIATPEEGPVGGVPALVALVVLVLAVAASFIVARLVPRLVVVDLATKIVIVAAVIGFMTSIERGLQHRLDARTNSRPAIVAALMVVLGLVAGVGGTIGCLRLSPALGDRGGLGLGFFAGGFWLAGLSLGTLLIRSLASRGTLEARTTRTLAAAFAIAALGSIAGARYAAPALELVTVRAPDLFAVWSPFRERAISSLGLSGIWTLASILLLALPLALSGCRKLVRQTFDGLSVLEAASETVAAGRLELRVEHHKYDGHVERVDASGFVAVFNAPLEQSDHMVRATRCAIECQTELSTLNKSGEAASLGSFALAIGVASGPLVSGTIEGNGQPRYVLLGETLELASRLANLTPSGQVWVNQRNAETLPMYIPSVMLAAISMRGRAHPVAPYRVWPPP